MPFKALGSITLCHKSKARKPGKPLVSLSEEQVLTSGECPHRLSNQPAQPTTPPHVAAVTNRRWL